MCPEGPARRQASEEPRLRRAFDRLPKTDHANDVFERHPEMRGEWVIRVMEDPYDPWIETDARGRASRVIAGRVEAAPQWIKVVFNSEGKLITALFDHRLESRFGGRPWPQSQ